MARNALRHGLAAASAADPSRTTDATALARRIAGLAASVTVFEAALDIAHAQVDLRRVHLVRDAIHARLAQAGASADAGALFAPAIEELTALDRYERRARSRRKFAIRTFDRVRAEQLKGGIRK